MERGKECAVVIQFDLNQVDIKKLFEIEKLLSEIGVTFDTGALLVDGGRRDWEWDWSLKGPVKAIFKSDMEEMREEIKKSKASRGQAPAGDGRESQSLRKDLAQEIIHGVLGERPRENSNQ